MSIIIVNVHIHCMVYTAGGRLYPLLRLFGLAMSPRNAIHRPKYAREPKSCLTNTGVIFRPVPSIGSIVLVMALHGRQNLL